MAGSSKSYFRDRPGGSNWTAAILSKTMVHPLSSTGTVTVTANGFIGSEPSATTVEKTVEIKKAGLESTKQRSRL